MTDPLAVPWPVVDYLAEQLGIAMLAVGRKFPDRTWAVEGCKGIDRIAQRLVADGESVSDCVPCVCTERAPVGWWCEGSTQTVDKADRRSAHRRTRCADQHQRQAGGCRRSALVTSMKW